MDQEIDRVTYIVRQPGKEDLRFESSQDAVSALVQNPEADLFVGANLVMQKRIILSPHWMAGHG